MRVAVHDVMIHASCWMSREWPIVWCNQFFNPFPARIVAVEVDVAALVRPGSLKLNDASISSSHNFHIRKRVKLIWSFLLMFRLENL